MAKPKPKPKPRTSFRRPEIERARAGARRPSAAAAIQAAMRRYPGDAPKQLGPAHSPEEAAARLPPPQSASFEAQIQNILTGLAGLPAAYNPERRSAAYGAAAGLGAAGYSDAPGVEEAGRDVAGNIAYRLVRGPDGALYRQAYRNIEAGQAGRGTLHSSFTRRQLGGQKRELDLAREQAVRDFEFGQAGSFQRQAADWTQGANALGVARGEYRDWQAQQPVALDRPVETVETPGTPMPIPAAAPSAISGSTPKPRVINVGQIESPHQASSLALQNPGYRLRKRGPKAGGTYVLVRQ